MLGRSSLLPTRCSFLWASAQLLPRGTAQRSCWRPVSSEAPLRPASATQWPAMPQPPCHVARPLVLCLLEMSQLECYCSLIPVDTSRLCSLLGFTPTIHLLYQRGLQAEAGPRAACPRATDFPWLPGLRPGPEPGNIFPPTASPYGWKLPTACLAANSPGLAHPCGAVSAHTVVCLVLPAEFGSTWGRWLSPEATLAWGVPPLL